VLLGGELPRRRDARKPAIPDESIQIEQTPNYASALSRGIVIPIRGHERDADTRSRTRRSGQPYGEVPKKSSANTQDRLVRRMHPYALGMRRA